MCFFRAASTDEPLDRFLGSDEVRCLSADHVIELPVGSWSYYLRNRSRELVTALPSVLRNDAPEYANAGYKQIADQFRPAARIDIAQLRGSLPPDERIGIYIANDGSKYPPALLPVVLLGIRQQQIVDIGDPMKLKPRERVRIADFPDRRAHPALVSWILFTPEARNPGDHWSRMPAPLVSLTTGTRTVSPAVAPRPGYGADGALVLFPDIPSGPWTLRLGGDVWRRDAIAGEASPHGAVLRRRRRKSIFAPEARVSEASRPGLISPRYWSQASRPRAGPCRWASASPPPPTWRSEPSTSSDGSRWTALHSRRAWSS